MNDLKKRLVAYDDAMADLRAQIEELQRKYDKESAQLQLLEKHYAVVEEDARLLREEEEAFARVKRVWCFIASSSALPLTAAALLHRRNKQHLTTCMAAQQGKLQAGPGAS